MQGAARRGCRTSLAARPRSEPSRRLSRPVKATSSDVLYDIPVSNNGARCRIAIYAKSLENAVEIKSPSELGGLKSDEYLALNPYGKMPMLTTGEGETIYESEVILGYLLDKYSSSGPSLRLGTPLERARSALATKVHDTYLQPVQGCMYRKANSAQERADQIKIIDEAMHVLETLCSPAPFFCGSDSSSPDCALFPTFVFCEFMLEDQFGWADAFYDKPNLRKWYDYLKKGGDGSDAVAAAAGRVYDEVFQALKAWEEGGRWEVQGVNAHLEEKDHKWVYP